MKKLQSGEIPDYVMEFVIDELKKIRSGELVFVAQDGYLMSVEVTDRRRLSDWADDFKPPSDEMFRNLKRQIADEFQRLKYGRLVVKIQKGRIMQFECTVQHRFTGLDGEGI